MMNSYEPKFQQLGGSTAPRRLLLCLPHAGASADVFRPWVPLVPDDVAIWSVDYPGRRTAAGLSPMGIHALGDSLAHQLDDLPAQIELRVFAHSMGALVAYEMLARIRQRLVTPALVASGCPAPQVRVSQPPPKDPVARVAELLQTGGTPAAALADPTFQAMLTDLMREDLRACDEYAQPSSGVSARITVLCALDDPVVTVESVLAWRRSSGEFRGIKYFSGGHLFPFIHPERVTNICLSS